MLADWGPGNNMTNDGGRTRLWLNDGAGRFTDATDARMPDVAVRFSWDLELADVDNDADLDILVSCKRCGGSNLFRNDGRGTFADESRAMPQYTNNYEFEPMDLDGDGFLDLVTMNDGEIVGGTAQAAASTCSGTTARAGSATRPRRGGRRPTTSARTTTWSPSSTTTPMVTPTSSSDR